MNNCLQEISNELYDLNQNLQSLMFLLGELHGRPIKVLRNDGSFELEGKND